MAGSVGTPDLEETRWRSRPRSRSVWPTRRIEWLFDSLMRDYPIGSFLFWKVQSQSIERYKFYDFMLKYDEKDNRHCRETGVIVDASRYSSMR